jgi:sugar phosphate isomerase/epimerase
MQLGVDTLCWHLRLERGGLSLEELLDEAAALGAGCVQVNLHHARNRSLEQLYVLSERARALGLQLLASGDFLGSPREGHSPEVGLERVTGWLERARALASPILRVVSGFYRAELAGRPDLVDAEQRYVTDVLRHAGPAAAAAGIALLLENHSDFTSAEFEAIVAATEDDNVGVFLDLINTVSALEPPVAVIERLAPLARAGHVKDYYFRSIPTDDGYHRRGFEVRWCYPGEGVADLAALIGTLRAGVRAGEYFLTVEGLDNRADVADQRERLAQSLALLRSLVGATP